MLGTWGINDRFSQGLCIKRFYHPDDGSSHHIYILGNEVGQIDA